MTVVPWFTVCIAINTIWAIFCIVMNHNWKKTYSKMNEEWCSYCNKINDKWASYYKKEKENAHDTNRRETDDPGYSQDSDGVGEDSEVDEQYGAAEE